MRLKNLVAIVTGATSGLGEEIAKGLAREGAKVAIVGRNEERGKGVESIIRSNKGEGRFFSADVTNESQVKRLVDDVLDEYGKIDIVVNNAGKVIPGNTVGLSLEQWEEVFKVNVTSTYLVSHYTLPHLLKGESSSIINIASEAGLKGLKDRTAYCAAKAAIVGYTKAMAVDHSGDGVRVNCICPGTIETPMVKNLIENHENPEGLKQQFIDRRLTPYLGSPSEIAEACIYFALPGNKYVTGAVLSIDGGALAK